MLSPWQGGKWFVSSVFFAKIDHYTAYKTPRKCSGGRMTTATRGQSALVKKAPKQEVAVEVSAPSRREFLYYIWGASIVMLLGQTTAGIVWFSLPRFREGEFGGVFRFAAGDLPPAGSAPISEPAGRFWVSNTEDGFMVLYAVCTHLGCLPKWQPTNTRFECPCHGSKFENDGAYIEGPAPRGLDRFRVTVVFADGEQVTSNEQGDPISLNGRDIADILIDTGSRILGPPH
jgi:cytochrome b6-f complex iron-sulfur subunit